jgi:hypothetical protein
MSRNGVVSERESLPFGRRLVINAGPFDKVFPEAKRLTLDSDVVREVETSLKSSIEKLSDADKPVILPFPMLGMQPFARDEATNYNFRKRIITT